MLDHILIMNATHAHRVLAEDQQHYNQHRPHQARDQQPPEAPAQPPKLLRHSHTHVLRKRLLGGLINEYRQAA
ncbi:transposase [Kibdelosporangium banguiense]|nr:transposase [Kibdelosporangium banguiense]